MSKTKNQTKGDIYEAFTKEILLMKELLWEYNGEFVSFNVIKNERTITGASGAKHQIDIHMTSKTNKTLHLICECKDHNRKTVKGLACSFVTVIDDIKSRHPKWNIIPVFASNTNFTNGAKLILEKYNIEMIYLKNLQNCKTKLVIKESFRVLKRKITKIYLSDDSFIENNCNFINYYRGDVLSPLNLLHYFELFDNNGNKIENLLEYRGFFKTGERKIPIEHEFDKFILLQNESKLELKGFEGEIIGIQEIVGDAIETTLTNDEYKGVLVNPDGTEYVFKKNNEIFKVNPINKQKINIK